MFDFDEWEEASDYQHRKIRDYLITVPFGKASTFVEAYQYFNDKLDRYSFKSVEVFKEDLISITLSSCLEPEEDISTIMECFNSNYETICQIFKQSNYIFRFEPMYL